MSSKRLKWKFSRKVCSIFEVEETIQPSPTSVGSEEARTGTKPPFLPNPAIR